MTLQEAKSIARHIGLTLRTVRSGKYRVNFRDGNETTAYYTDCLEDAINAAVEMARKRKPATDSQGIWSSHSAAGPGHAVLLGKMLLSLE